jgi:hypothetical protein
MVRPQEMHAPRDFHGLCQMGIPAASSRKLAAAPVELHPAVWDAHHLAREFDSPRPAYPLPWIRERQLWGGETVPAQPMPW